MVVAAKSQKTRQGAGLRFLTGPITSPSLADLLATILTENPQARWHQYDPVTRDGARLATGSPTNVIYHFDKADVVVSLDADFLASGPGCVRYQKDFASRRRVTDDRKEMNRFYAIESTPSLTGAKADHRLVLKAGEIEGFARQLSGSLGAGSGSSPSPESRVPSPEPANADAAKWVAALAKDLQAHRGTSLVVAGDYQPAAVHAAAHAMNQALGNVGATVTYGAPIEAAPADQAASLNELVRSIDAGQVELLVILGGNPVYTAPADLKFSEKLVKVGMTVYHGLHVDETANLCQWNVAEAHPLESWGDARAYDGTVTIIQPLIAPLYEGRSAHEVLGVFTAQPDRHGSQIVKDYWTRAFGGASGWSIRGADGLPFKDADTFWRRALHDGFIGGTAIADGGQATPFTAPSAGRPVARGHAVRGRARAAAPAPQGGLEIIFRPDPTIWDGRFANNGWLQELPKPLTKITWDTSAWISPQLAKERGLSDGDVIELRYRGNTARMPVFRVPGHPAQSVTVFLGYGRRLAGRVGTATAGAEAFNAYLLRTSDAPWFGSGLEISKTGDRYLLATTQEHHLMEGRVPVRVATLEQVHARAGRHPRIRCTAFHGRSRCTPTIPTRDTSGAWRSTSPRARAAARARWRARPRTTSRSSARSRSRPDARCTGFASIITSRGRSRTSRAASLSRRTTSPCPACSARTRRASSSVRWPRRRTAPRA